jgi:hypothetical protein
MNQLTSTRNDIMTDFRLLSNTVEEEEYYNQPVLANYEAWKKRREESRLGQEEG